MGIIPSTPDPARPSRVVVEIDQENRTGVAYTPAPEEQTYRISAAALRDPVQLAVDLKIALRVSGVEPRTDGASAVEQNAAATALLRALGVEAVSE